VTSCSKQRLLPESGESVGLFTGQSLSVDNDGSSTSKQQQQQQQQQQVYFLTRLKVRSASWPSV